MNNQRYDSILNLENLEKFQRELGRLFEGDWVKPSGRDFYSGFTSPKVDTIETDSDYVYLMNLPGVALDSIDVSVHRGAMKVKGSWPESTNGTVLSSERPVGHFERTIELPEDAEENSVSASMKAGVLSLTVTKASDSIARSVPVREVD